MHKLFKKWIEKNKSKLMDMGINTEIIRFTDNTEEILDNVIVIESISKNYFGEVTVWNSGYMDMEIIDKETGKQCLWIHKDLTEDSNFDEIMYEYVNFLIS